MNTENGEIIRKAYICVDCGHVYLDEPVISCDCMEFMPSEFYVGEIRYSEKKRETKTTESKRIILQDEAIKRLRLKTFDEWNIRDRYIVMGEKAEYQNTKGVCLFDINQTRRKNNGYISNSSHSSYSPRYDEECWEDCGLTAYDLGADF